MERKALAHTQRENTHTHTHTELTDEIFPTNKHFSYAGSVRSRYYRMFFPLILSVVVGAVIFLHSPVARTPEPFYTN